MLRRAGTRLSRALAARPRAFSPLAWSSSSSSSRVPTAGPPPGLLARASYCHDASALSPFAGSDAPAMPAADKFLFDTNGFVIVRGVFGADDLARFHAGIDAHAHEIH